jgi:hypothetical protein
VQYFLCYYSLSDSQIWQTSPQILGMVGDFATALVHYATTHYLWTTELVIVILDCKLILRHGCEFVIAILDYVITLLYVVFIFWICDKLGYVMNLYGLLSADFRNIL